MKVQVIEKKKGRIDRTTGEIIKENLRVCAYARVSILLIPKNLTYKNRWEV